MSDWSDTMHKIAAMNYPVFEVPCTIFVSGSSQSGKSSFALRVLREWLQFYNKEVANKFLFYKTYQPIYDEFLQAGVILKTGLPDFSALPENSFILLDDLIGDALQNTQFYETITVSVHHRNLSIMLLTQNLFLKGLRNIRTNSQGLVLMKSPGDRLGVETLGRQLYPKRGRAFMDCYLHATALPYTYLIVDLSIKIPEEMRLRAKVFSGENPGPIVYSL